MTPCIQVTQGYNNAAWLNLLIWRHWRFDDNDEDDDDNIHYEDSNVDINDHDVGMGSDAWWNIFGNV